MRLEPRNPALTDPLGVHWGYASPPLRDEPVAARPTQAHGGAAL
jgi:hypothetical protein